MIKKLIFFLCICIQTIHSSYANIPILTDSAQLSLLTNAQWQGEVYSVFGHTAIRVKDKSQNIDHIFNYGLFDFNSPNFLFRFIKGQTDYMVGVIDYTSYLSEYKSRGVVIHEQILNLTPREKQNIWKDLCFNILPQNREYRYNFFFDNCSTRPRDIIEKNIEGTINYNPTNKTQTFRDLIHECVKYKPWLMFGIDLVIGSEADKIATDKDKMFLPEYLMNSYSTASITLNDGSEKRLIFNERTLIEKEHLTSKLPIYYPLYTGICILIGILVLSIFNYKTKFIKFGKFVDFFIFSSFGIAGCIIAFLMFFSEHPCTIPNWNIVWLNPIQLLLAFLFFVKQFAKAVYYYHFINFAVLMIFFLLWMLIPQHLELAFIPFILIIWIRSLVGIFQYKQESTIEIIKNNSENK